MTSKRNVAVSEDPRGFNRGPRYTHAGVVTPATGGKSGDADYDPMCDPDKPREVTFQEISAAAYRIQTGVLKTPCMPSHFSPQVGLEMYLKCEFLQFTGSFKERGIRNAMMLLPLEKRKFGIAAASLGNHSQGVSYHGKLLGINTTVVMPVIAPLVKIEKCRGYGANVVIIGNSIGDCKAHAIKLCKEKNMTYINGYDHPDVIAGQGTIGLEILEQVPDVDAILVPVGGGGLISGIAIAVKHLKPSCLIYGVETDKCASMTEAIKAGKVVKYEITRTLADGLAVGTVGVNSFYNIKELVDKMVVVSEDWATRAILNIMELEKYIVEGAGAVAVAAILSGIVPELKGKKVVCIMSGANIDTTVLSTCLDQGLASEHRLVKFKVNISTSPGSMSELCSHMSDIGISIKDIGFERAWLQGNIFIVRVKVVCETRGFEHYRELRDVISSNYRECYFMRENPDERHYSLTDSLQEINTALFK